MLRKIGKTLVGVAAGLALAATNAAAAIDLTGVSYNTADVLAIAALVIAAIAVIWGVRKAIAVANRG